MLNADMPLKKCETVEQSGFEGFGLKYFKFMQISYNLIHSEI